jgi:hypothetical protein
MVLIAVVCLGCGPGFKAPAAPTGQAMTLSVVFDRGLDGRTEDQQNQLNQLGEWMENDLLRMARQGGYDARLIGPGDQLELGPGHYLLTVVFTDYNPGSKAARMLVGFGAGSAALDVHFELRGAGEAPLLVRDHGRASSKDWNYIARKVNQDMLIAVSDAIAAQ